MTLSPPIKFLVVTGHERGLQLGLTSGVFDLIHVNHIRFIQDAARGCENLFVAVNSDRTARMLKGEGRPIIPEAERVEIVQQIKGVYAAFLFDDPDPVEIIREIRPARFFKGKERQGTDMPEIPVINEVGAQLCFVGPEKDHSTTDLLARLRGRV